VACFVDSNLILDIATDDPVWGDWSDAQIANYQENGLLINPVIYAELCAGAQSTHEVDLLIESLGLNYRDLPREALFLAAKAFLQYRRNGGTKLLPLPDFFIGAHAESLGIAIITRDPARYQTYFPKVELIKP
jgi:predicted nucleic acid-binding protein